MSHDTDAMIVQRDSRAPQRWSAGKQRVLLPGSEVRCAERWHGLPRNVWLANYAEAQDLRARVVLADRVDLIRAGLRSALGTDSHLHVVGEARDGREAVATVQRFQADLLVLDADMPDIDSFQTLQLLQRTCPKTRVLLFGARPATDFAYQAVQAAVAGYVQKAASLAEVLSAVRAALQDECPVDTHTARQVLRQVIDKQSLEAPPVPHLRLSAREIEVVDRIALGRTNRQIAEELVITVHTVKSHIEHILAKLNVRDRTQAAVRAVELGYVREGRRAA
jgi:DNA-binding NarL/FixJ family response regulator